MARIVISQKAISHLVHHYAKENSVPTIVEFAAELEEAARNEDPMQGPWYDTCLPHLLLVIGKAARGENPDLMLLEFWANTEMDLLGGG